MRKLMTTTLILSSLISLNTYATVSGDRAKERVDGEEIETITVVGERPIRYFRKLMKKEEMRFYDMYNALTVEDDYKIECGTLNRGGVAKNVCAPNYVRRLEHSILKKVSPSSDFNFRYSYFTTQESRRAILPELKRHQKLHLQHVEQLVENNPALHNQLARFADSKALYKLRHDQKFKDHWSTKLANWFKN